MDLTCKFAQEYLPTPGRADPIAEIHVENCPDCQAESRFE